MNSELQAALWKEYNAGRMPVGLRMAYALYAEAMRVDPDFEALVELGEVRPSYQGLPITFDTWHPKTPHIETKPIEKPA